MEQQQQQRARPLESAAVAPVRALPPGLLIATEELQNLLRTNATSTLDAQQPPSETALHENLVDQPTLSTDVPRAPQGYDHYAAQAEQDEELSSDEDSDPPPPTAAPPPLPVELLSPPPPPPAATATTAHYPGLESLFGPSLVPSAPPPQAAVEAPPVAQPLALAARSTSTGGPIGATAPPPMLPGAVPVLPQLVPVLSQPAVIASSPPAQAAFIGPALAPVTPVIVQPQPATASSTSMMPSQLLQVAEFTPPRANILLAPLMRTESSGIAYPTLSVIPNLVSLRREANDLAAQSEQVQNQPVSETELSLLLRRYRDRLLAQHETLSSVVRARGAAELIERQVWETRVVETEHIAECGHRKRVRFPVRSLMDYFKQDVATQLAAALSRMRELSHEKLPEHEYFSQFAKLQIELYLDEQLVASQYLMNSAQNTNAAGNLELMNDDLRSPSDKREVMLLRQHVGDLFRYEREATKEIDLLDREKSPLETDTGITSDEKRSAYSTFRDDVRAWLQKMVGVLLRCASASDYRFVLLQALETRRISEWGVAMVQLPLVTDETTLVCFLSALYLLLQPSQRALMSLGVDLSHSSDQEELNQWIILSNSNEQVTLRSEADEVLEDDKSAILDQFPFSSVYHYLFAQGSARPQAVQQAAQFLASILCIGVALHRRASHFCKMLAKLVVGICNGFASLTQQRQLQLQQQQQAAHEHSYHQAMFLLGSGALPLQQQQQQLHELVLQCTQGLLAANEPKVWQFLPQLPFSSVDECTAWRLTIAIFGYDTESSPRGYDLAETKQWLVQSHKNTADQPFVARISQSHYEAIFLIHALQNLATKSSELAQLIMAELFYISYIDADTRKDFYKPVSDVIGALANVFPSLMSQIIGTIDRSFAALGHAPSYLFKKLPLFKFLPTDEDMWLIQNWLVKPLESDECKLARYILDHMNWGLCEQTGHELFLSAATHSRTAVFLVQAYFHHMAEPQSFFSFSRSVRTEFFEWCFAAILRTRHWTIDGSPMAEQLDLTTLVGKSLLEEIKGKPEPDILSVFACLEFTHIGRKPTVFFERGVKMLQLVSEQHEDYRLALRILHDLIPNAVRCEAAEVIEYRPVPRLTQLLTTMFHSEQSLFGKLITSQRIAKDSTLKLQLLISRQILAALTMAQKKNLITFWFTEIQAHPRWWRDRCCLTLLDAVCQAALLCECSSHVLMHLQAAQYGMCTPKEKIVFPNERDSVATSPYAAFLLLYQELLVDLPVMEAYAYKYAANPAAGARRIMLSVLEPQGRTLDDLAVLRWLEHGCFLVSESSPLLVLYWQVLFSFLFRRLPPTNWPVYRVACDIFPTLPARIIGRLHELQRYFQPQSSVSLVESKFELFSSMAHWTELLEQVGNGGVLDPGRLGPAFNVPRLIGVLTSCPTPFDELWKEFTIEAIVSCSDPTLVAALASGDMQAMAIALVDIRAVSQLGSDICPNPMAEMHRAAATAQPQSMVALGTQSQLVHLVYPQSRAQLPPPCVIREPLVRPYPLSHCDTGIEYDIAILLRATSQYDAVLAQFISLDQEYLELLSAKHTSQQSPVIVELKCEPQCKMPTQLSVLRPQGIENKAVVAALATNRERSAQLTNSTKIGLDICVSVLRIQRTVERLVTFTMHGTATEGSQQTATLIQTGQRLFYRLLTLLNATTLLFPPTRSFLEHSLRELAMHMVARFPDQCHQFLEEAVLGDALRAPMFTPLFDPLAFPTQFIDLYQVVLERGRSFTADLITPILVRFEVEKWARSGGNPADMVQLIALLGKELTNYPQREPIWPILLEQFVTLAQYDFPSNLRDILGTLVKCSVDKHRMPVAVWERVLHALPWSQMRANLAVELAAWVGDTMWKIRTSSQRPLFQIWEPYVASYEQLVTSLFEAVLGNAIRHAEPMYRSGNGSSSNNNNNNGSMAATQCWEVLGQLFSPWLLTVTLDPRSGSSATLEPWSTDDQDAAIGFCACFTDQVIRLCSLTPQTISWFWNYYCSALSPLAGVHVQQVYLVQFVRLPWNSWEPSSEVMMQMIALAASSKFKQEYYYFLLRAIFMAINWRSLPNLAEVGPFLLRLLIIFHHAHPIASCREFDLFMCEFASFDWTRVLPDAYAATIAGEEVAYSIAYYTSPPMPGSRATTSSSSSSSSSTASMASGALATAASGSAGTLTDRFLIVLRLLRFATGFESRPIADFTAGGEPLISPAFEKLTTYTSTLVGLFANPALANNPAAIGILHMAFQELFQLISERVSHVFNYLPQSRTLLLLQNVMILNNSPLENEGDRIEQCTLDMVRRAPTLAPLLLSASCRSIASIAKLATICERSIESYFQAANSWSVLEASLLVPELSEADFLEHCVRQCYYLTLCVFIRQKMYSSQLGPYQDLTLVNVCSVALRWVREIQLVLGKEYLYVLLCGLVLRLIFVTNAMPRVKPMEPDILAFLARVKLLAQDRENEGSFLGFFSAKSPYPTHFRLCMKAISSFLESRTTPEGRVIERTIFSASLAQNRACQQLLSLRSNSEYQMNAEVIRLGHEFLTDASMHLDRGCSLAKLLGFRLYPNNKEFEGLGD